MQWISEVPKPEYNGKRVVVREESNHELAYYVGVIVGNIVVYEGAIHGDPQNGAPIHNIVTGITEPQDDADTIITDFDGDPVDSGYYDGSVHPYTYSKYGTIMNYSYAILD